MANQNVLADYFFKEWYRMLQMPEADHMGAFVDKLIPGRWRPVRVFRKLLTANLKMTVQPSSRIVAALGEAAVFHGWAIACCTNKCFFLTEKARFGVAPDPSPVTVEAGDRIAVFGGMAQPFLLRPVEGGYRILAHVYVHGIMDGEAWPEDEADVEEIVLA